MMRFTRALGLAVIMATPAAAQPTLQTGIPITVSAPPSVSGVHSWPVTAGIPFPKGLIGGFEDHTIMDDANHPVPCQIDKVGFWPDNTVRWARADFIADPARTYRLVAGPRAPFTGITLQQTGSGLLVTTGPARYFFPAGAATFDRVELDVNGDHVFQSDEVIVSGAQGAFYLVDSAGQRAVLGGGVVSIENAGPLHAVVRAEGTYRLTGGARRAAAVIYFHFYAGLAQVRVSHKFLVTEDTEAVWFREVGFKIPVSIAGLVRASFNHVSGDPTAVASAILDAGEEAVMAQQEFPHHDRDASRFSVERRGTTGSGLLASGTAAGDWADLFDERIGLAAQVPAFAEQAPKALRVAPGQLTVELWSAEGGRELDFRRNAVYAQYFDSWFNAFAGTSWATTHTQQVLDGTSTLPSNGTGTAKVHDIWLYPHAGVIQPATLGATREEIVARADPAWIAASGVFGPIHPFDMARFPSTEKAIDDYYTRSVFISQRVFPQTGYLFYGQYPYVAQPWDFRSNRWYPEWHRLARQLEYNLRRSMWVLWARGGDRKYYDFARRNTRHMGDFLFSNADVIYKPLGWTVEGLFHSAIPWGHYGRPSGQPGYSSNSSACLAVASSEDVIQFVYDYYLTGDYHSRDVARNWKQAMLTVMQPGVDLNLAVRRAIDRGPAPAQYPNAFELPYLFLRVLGSIYELDQDPLVYTYGHAILDKLADNGGSDNILNPAYRTNFAKQLEAVSSYYHYWISTGDPVAQTVLLRYADFAYHFGRVDGFFSRRNGAVPMAFAVAWQDKHDPAVAAYLAQAVREYGRDTVTLQDEGLDETSFSATSPLSWKPQILDEQAVVGLGLPLAMAATVDATARGAAFPEVPYVDKPVAAQPTYLVLDKGFGTQRIDLWVNDIGGRDFQPVLRDLSGNPQGSLTELARQQHREIEPPPGVALSDRQWYGMAESQIFISLEIPGSVPAGVYTLDLGRDVAYRVLYTDVPRVEQVAPDGIVVSPGSALIFPVPTSPVDLFAYRGFRVFDTAGQEIAKTALDLPAFGRFRFSATPGSVVSIEPGPDPYFAAGVSGGETYIRLTTIPAIIASGDPGRLFAVNPASFPSSIPATLPSAISGSYAYAPGFAGDGIVLYRSVVETPAPASFPFGEGTIEFWMRPLWSTTDWAVDRPSGTLAVPMAKRLDFFSMPPFRVSYSLNPDNSGVTSRYVTTQLKLQLDGMQAGNDGGGTVLKYPTRIYFQRGRWYHIAVTWKIDGTSSDIALFVNGREKSFEIFDEELGSVRATLNYSGSPVPGGPIRFGAGKPCASSQCDPPGEQFDELRISRTRRYTGDFIPPAAPFANDSLTYLLMHFDGNLVIDGSAATASVVGSAP